MWCLVDLLRISEIFGVRNLVDVTRKHSNYLEKAVNETDIFAKSLIDNIPAIEKSNVMWYNEIHLEESTQCKHFQHIIR